MSNKISVILPTYNEKENITSLVEEIIDHLKTLDYEVIIVDDFSPDGTGEIAQELEKKYNPIKVIIRKKDKGLAKSIKEGILSSQGDYVVVMDTDFSHPPKMITSLLKEMNKNDLVIASRYIKGGSMDAPFYKFFLSKILNQTIGFILGLDIKDLTGGFFIIRKKALKGFDMGYNFKGYGDYFFKLSYLLKNQGAKIKEVPFRYEIRKYGKSKTILIKIGISYIIQAMKIRLKINN